MTPEQIRARLAHLVTAFDAVEEKKAAAWLDALFLAASAAKMGA